jgi:hypothetical protein
MLVYLDGDPVLADMLNVSANTCWMGQSTIVAIERGLILCKGYCGDCSVLWHFCLIIHLVEIDCTIE